MILIKKQQNVSITSGKTDKYEYLTDEEILPDQSQIIPQTRFAYSPLRKALKNQAKTIKLQGKNQAEAFQSLNPCQYQLKIYFHKIF